MRKLSFEMARKVYVLNKPISVNLLQQFKSLANKPASLIKLLSISIEAFLFKTTCIYTNAFTFRRLFGLFFISVSNLQLP